MPRNVRTKECTRSPRQDSYEQCKPLLALRQEMATAIRKRELEAEPRLTAELDKQQRPEEADASELLVGGVWAWIMGLGVVFVATFGTVIWSYAETVPPVTANDNDRALKRAETRVSAPRVPPVPPSSQTWTGRGRRPMWLIKAGGDIEKYRVG